jgi:hypothetical protein
MVTITSEENLVTKKDCDDKEKCLADKIDACDKNTQFIWIIGLLMAIIMAVFSYAFYRIGIMENKVDDYQIINAKIEAQLAQIQTDLAWIKTTLKK